MTKRKDASLTTPDLVLLSLLAERPMHGYQANLELERRQVRDWAGISRPQVYYSLDKLAHADLIRASRDHEAAVGPERRVFSTTSKGNKALAHALSGEHWAMQRDRPPFLTWLALSWQAHPETFSEQIERRRAFLEKELEREEETLAAVRKEVGHEFHEAVWMLTLTIEQFRTELRWLKDLKHSSSRRKPAKNPALIDV
jgi:DNA-binding PadR family transcriptional regulator